jgi:hypothetical protein
VFADRDYGAKVFVDARSREVFSYQAQIVPANRVAAPAPWVLFANKSSTAGAGGCVAGPLAQAPVKALGGGWRLEIGSTALAGGQGLRSG